MKVYVCHPKAIDYEEELYDPLRKYFPEVEFIFPYGNNQRPKNSSEYLKGKNCDLVLAEVSEPSTGQGIELGWANLSDISIICFYKKGKHFSRSLVFICDKIIEYENINQFIEKLNEEFKTKN